MDFWYIPLSISKNTNSFITFIPSEKNKLSKLEFVDEIIIPPSPGDSGAAIGAAYYGYLKSGNSFRVSKENDFESILSPGHFKNKIVDEKKDKIKKSLTFLKNKAKTLEDIYNNSQYIINDEVNFNKEDLKLIDANAQKIISEFKDNIKEISNFTRENLEPIVQELIKSNNTNFKGVGQPLRVALTGSKFGPGIYDIIISLGKEEVEKRLSNKTIS